MPPRQPPPAAPSGYLVGSASPLTTAQVDQLKAAGAQLHTAYRNFGGAAAAIPSSKLTAVRALPFVTSVSPDPIRKLATASDPAAAPLPNAPYRHDQMDLENVSTETGAGVWVAVLDTGFYPNWRDYFVESDILTDKAAPESWGPGDLERRLEATATPLAPGSVTVTHRTGTPLVETWGADAIGHGWVFADDAVNAAG